MNYAGLEEKFQREREHFPLLQDSVYLSSASTAPIPDYVYNAWRQYCDDRYFRGDHSKWRGMDTMAMIDWAKSQLAEVIGGKKENIAFGDNSSRMLNLFVQGLPIKPGDNILLSEDTFISSRFAWQMKERQGAELRFVPTSQGMLLPEDIFSAADGRTRAVSLCYAESSTGFRADIETLGRLCRKKGIFFCVDGVQSIGVLPVNAEKMNIDFLVGNDYKWMLGYCGTGFAYISRRLMESLKPWGAGWMSDSDRFNTEKKVLDLRKDAGKFEMGYPNVIGIFCLGLAAERYLQLGSEDIEKHVEELHRYLLQKTDGSSLKPVYRFSEKNRGSIVYLRTDCSPDRLRGFLSEKKIFVDFHGDSIRISLHYFNNKRDIDRLVDAVEMYRAKSKGGEKCHQQRKS